MLIGSVIWEPSWLCLWAEFVCEAGKFFQRCFLETIFFTRRGHFKELQVKGNLFNCSQILTVASFAYKQQKGVSKFFISKYFFSGAIFVRSIHIFLILFQKRSVTFHWHWIWQIADTFFLALWPRKRRNTLNKWKTKFALTGNAQKVILALAFRSREKFDNSFFSKIFGIVW